MPRRRPSDIPAREGNDEEFDSKTAYLRRRARERLHPPERQAQLRTNLDERRTSAQGHRDTQAIGFPPARVKPAGYRSFHRTSLQAPALSRSWGTSAFGEGVGRNSGRTCPQEGSERGTKGTPVRRDPHGSTPPPEPAVLQHLVL